MKNLFKYTLAIAAMVLAASCTKEPVVEPGQPDVEGCYGVFFPSQEATGDHIMDPTQDPEVTFTVKRSVSKGDVTVPVTVKASEDGIFEVGKLSFTDGQEETSLLVKFPKAVEGTKYTLSLSIDDNKYASIYNTSAVTVDFSVMRVSYVDFPGKITFTEGFWEETHTVNMKYYEIDGIRYCVIPGDQKCDKDCDPAGDGGLFGTGVDVEFVWYADAKYNYTLDDDSVVEPINFKMTPLYVDSSYGQVYVSDWFTYWKDWKNDPAVPADFFEFCKKYWSNYPECYYDGNGGFFFNLKYYVSAGSFSSDEYDVVGIAEGFTRTDYSLKAEIDYSSKGVLPVYYKAGADVNQIDAYAYEGELTATQINNKVSAISAGTEKAAGSVAKADIVDGEAQLGLSFEKSGTYTVISVSRDDKNTVQAVATVCGPYVAAADVEANAVDIHVVTEDTPARYLVSGTNTKRNSFSYYIYGSGLTEAHVIVAEYKKFAAAQATYLAALATEDYQVKDAVLEQINAEGGFTSLVSGVKAGTQYIVLVYATNGQLAKTIGAVYTTEEDPETWHKLGTGLYTEDIVIGMFSESYTEAVSYEVEIEESDKVAGRYKVVYPYDGKFPMNEAGDWDTSASYDLVIEASDPTYVYFTRQELGINYIGSMMTAVSMVGYYMENGYTLEQIKGAGIAGGTLADGVITFPVKGILMDPGNGKNYYANPNGWFKVVLPSAYTKAVAPAAVPAAAKAQFNSNAGTFKLARKSIERDPQTVSATAVKVAPKAKSSEKKAPVLSKKQEVFGK